jgi:hypothetical protein
MTTQSRISRNKGSFFEEVDDKLLSPMAAELTAVKKEDIVDVPAAKVSGDGFWLVVICKIAVFIVTESSGKGDSSAIKIESIAGGLVLSFSSMLVDGRDGGQYFGL